MQDVKGLLRAHGINATTQRLQIARVLFGRRQHLSAEQIYELVAESGARVSKATVYNTLSLFVANRLVRPVTVDPTKVFYDPNTSAHHHFYDSQSGELLDIDAEAIHITGLPDPPPGKELDGIEVIVRLRERG